MQKAPAERELNDVGSIHNGMKAIVEDKSTIRNIL